MITAFEIRALSSFQFRRRLGFSAMKAAALALLATVIASPAVSQESGATVRVVLYTAISTQIKGTANFLLPFDAFGMSKGTAILTEYSVGPGPFNACVTRIIQPNGASTYAGGRCLAKITPLPETKIRQFPREVQIDGGQILLMTWGE